MAASIALGVVGILLMGAPAILGYTGPAASLHLALGPVFATLGIVAASRVVRPVRRAAFPLAVLLAAAPVPLGMAPLPSVVSLVAAIPAGVIALLPVRTAADYGGGWSSLVGAGDARPPDRR